MKRLPAYRSYLLALLTVILAFNFIDRFALGLLLQDIKSEFDLTDTQLGLLSGIAFALFYSVMGIPIARWADRGNRVTIISLTAAVWSVMVALCGMATSFVQLLLIRVGVGIGEAGCIPPAHSLIADNFTRAERPRAAAIYALGGPLSYVIGYVVAGWLNEFYGWRTTFVMLGLPGLVLAALAWFTLREPRRRVSPMQETALPSLKEVFVTLWAIRTFRHLLLGFSLIFFFGYGITLWQPAFFMRSFGLHTGEIGTWLAIIYGVGGLTGTYLGGAVASRHAANNEQLQLKAIALAMIGHGLLSVFTYLSPNRYCAFGLLTVATLAGASLYGPLLATIQTLVPERMRAMSIALLYFFANLIGMGLGPLAAGALSDVLRTWAGEDSLRYALLMLCPGYVWAAWHLWQGSRTVTRDVEGAPSDNDSRAMPPNHLVIESRS